MRFAWAPEGLDAVFRAAAVSGKPGDGPAGDAGPAVRFPGKTSAVSDSSHIFPDYCQLVPDRTSDNRTLANRSGPVCCGTPRADKRHYVNSPSPSSLDE